MASRALDFATTHPVADSGFAATVKRLTDAVAAADAIAIQEHDGRIGESAALEERNTARRAVGQNQLARLARVAQLAAADHPELRGKFKPPSANLPNKTYVIAAQSILTAATAAKDVLMPLGLGDTLLDDLAATLKQLAATTEAAHNSRTDHVAARADFRLLVRDCMNAVTVLGTYYRATLPADSELLVAWESARNVAGPYQHQATDTPPPAPAPVPAPVSAPPQVSEAA